MTLHVRNPQSPFTRPPVVSQGYRLRPLSSLIARRPQLLPIAKGGRGAFTLVELLVVITILLVLATLTFAMFSSGRSSDRARSAARVAQSVFLGAKDRALNARDRRGVRFIRDATDNTLITGFQYLAPIANQVYGLKSIQLERADRNQDGIPDSADVVIVRGFDGSESPPPPTTQTVNWAVAVPSGCGPQPPTPIGQPYGVSQFFGTPGRIRIPASPAAGQWYTFYYTVCPCPNWNSSCSDPYALQTGSEVLQLATPFLQPGSAGIVAWDASSGLPPTSCEIELIAQPLPFQAPISLPSGMVIDLSNSSSNIQVLSGLTAVNNSSAAGANVNIDIMFSPRGMVYGFVAGLGPLHFAIRDIQDATVPDPNPLTYGQRLDPANQLNPANPAASPGIKGDIFILTVFPQTGLVATFEADLTDVVNNTTGAAGADGHADNLFTYAQRAMSAGR
jgi:prepilin-type N-terminal cleavage/methylation domain-containing protein